MSKPNIWFADLTHTAQGISAATFPLGVSFVLSYAREQLGHEFEFRLFKFPSHLEEALREETPAMLCFSNYSWNFELAYKFASLAKARHPELVTVFGGPNFPTDQEEKLEFLRKRPGIDFYVELEGELGFVDLVENLLDCGMDAMTLKRKEKRPLNTSYTLEDRLVSGVAERIRDINTIPSPYLTGVLDEYFGLPLIPMIETTRGCPFSCTFCADGIGIKNKVVRYDSQRTKDELHYIAKNVRNMEELIITDLNFAMYQNDVVTARVIAETQRIYQYPTLISASAGKNKPKRTIEVAGIIDGWTLGASIQSTDPVVLGAIKRTNISTAAYQELIEFGNSVDTAKTHSEIILGMPGDTKEKHFESLRFGIENGVNSMRMFQAILLSGTEMASQADRENYGLITRFRTIPGCIGEYEILNENHSVAEIEEIILGSNTFPVNDYLDCRIMNLIVETFYNNAQFEEYFHMVRAIGGSPFNCLLFIKEHPELYSQRITEIIGEFVKETTEDLFETFDEAVGFVLSPENLDRYVGGELGTNELLLHRALLFSEFDDICELVHIAVEGTLEQAGLLSPKVENYLDNLKCFTLMRKNALFTDTESVKTSNFDYDFQAISEANFKVDPNFLPRADSPIELTFFHNEVQKEHIANQVRIYSASAVGLGKLLQRTNLKLMYRNFAKFGTET